MLGGDARHADGARYTPREISKCFRILLVKTRNLLHVFTRSASQRATGTFGSAQDDAGESGLLHDADARGARRDRRPRLSVFGK